MSKRGLESVRTVASKADNPRRMHRASACSSGEPTMPSRNLRLRPLNICAVRLAVSSARKLAVKSDMIRFAPRL